MGEEKATHRSQVAREYLFQKVRVALTRRGKREDPSGKNSKENKTASFKGVPSIGRMIGGKDLATNPFSSKEGGHWKTPFQKDMRKEWGPL